MQMLLFIWHFTWALQLLYLFLFGVIIYIWNDEINLPINKAINNGLKTVTILMFSWTFVDEIEWNTFIEFDAQFFVNMILRIKFIQIYTVKHQNTITGKSQKYCYKKDQSIHLSDYIRSSVLFRYINRLKLHNLIWFPVYYSYNISVINFDWW